jgi:predicted exporter
MTTRHRAAVLLLWGLALLAGAAVIARSQFTTDLSAFLPASTDARQRVLIDQLRDGTPSRTLMLGIEGGDAAQRSAASRSLAAALRASGAFEAVHNGEQDAWADIGRWLFERRYQLSPAVTPERYTAEGLREALDETYALLGTPAGAALKPLLASDPTGETRRLAEALLPSQAPRREGGVWVSRAGDRAVLMASVRAAGADLDAQAAAIAAARTAFAPQAAQGLRLLMSGTPLFSVDSRAQIQHEVHRLALAGTVLMSALLLLAFASPAALGVALLPVGTGIVAGIAAVSLGFGNVHGVTLGFGSTLIGEAVDYAIYYLIQARGAAGRPDGQGGSLPGWRTWLRSGWPTVRLGLLTSVCGFAALLFSGFPGLAQLGLFSIAGLLGAAAATRWVLPVLMPDGSRGVGLRRQLGRAAAWALRRLPRTRGLWLLLAGAALLLTLQRGALWDADLASLSPVSPEALALDARLRADLGSGDGGALVVVQADAAEAVLQRAEAVATRLDGLVDRGQLAAYDSVTRFLPSLRTQAQRRAALPAPAELQAALVEATRGGPLPASRLQAFVDAVAQARTAPPDTPERVRGSPVAPLVDALLLRGADGRWTALLRLHAPTGTQDLATDVDTAAVAAALADLPDAHVLVIGDELGRLYRRYLGEARTQALLGGLAVLLLMAAVLRQPRRVLAVCQPLLLAVLLTLGGLALLGVQLGILHLVGFLLVVAVGSNYALFFDLLGVSPPGADPGAPSSPGAVSEHEDLLASLLLANLTTVLSFALLAGSQIPALSAIGRVVAPGALLALVLAAAFVPRSGGASSGRS